MKIFEEELKILESKKNEILNFNNDLYIFEKIQEYKDTNKVNLNSFSYNIHFKIWSEKDKFAFDDSRIEISLKYPSFYEQLKKLDEFIEQIKKDIFTIDSSGILFIEIYKFIGNKMITEVYKFKIRTMF